ncbi:MAG: radical SAM protein [Oscillospiraceae bacterium]|nr:radical SAM protein [Oscillospiraceae bacterium]
MGENKFGSVLQNVHSFFVQWHLTGKCNLQCTHCYQNQDYNEIKQISIEEQKNFIKETVEDFKYIYPNIEFNLTGGEPLLYPYFWEIVQGICDSNSKWNLLTNGTLIDENVVERLVFYRVSGVQVSLEGNKRINDIIRGDGNYEAVLKSVLLMKQAGIRVTIATTLTKLNFQVVDHMLELGSKLGVMMGFHRFIPMGQAANLSERIQLTAKEWKHIIFHVANLKFTQGLNVSINDPLFGCALFDAQTGFSAKKYLGRQRGCTIGAYGVTVLCDGFVVPCRKLPIYLGNVFDERLVDIWLNSDYLWKFRDRKHLKGNCGICEKKILCGGCRAFAYWDNDLLDPLSPDALCIYDN